MIVQQAVFTSTRSRKSQGYHLVAGSEGVDESIARSLTVWGPSHAALLSDEPNAESLNFHPVKPGWYAISRTVHGGPEYSGRGGLEVYTHFLLIQDDQLRGYQNDPLSLACPAQALGFLRFKPDPQELLPTVEIPDHPIAGVPRSVGHHFAPLQDVLRILNMQNRVAVLGLDDPLPVLAQILREIPLSERPSVSFCTGLRLSVDRAFRVHFARRSDASMRAQLTSQGIDYVTTV